MSLLSKDNSKVVMTAAVAAATVALGVGIYLYISNSSPATAAKSGNESGAKL